MFHIGGLFEKKRVYSLSEVNEDDPVQFGKKASVLARLVRLKLAVPAAFVICSSNSDISRDRVTLSDSLKKQIKTALHGLEDATGRRLACSDSDGSGSGSGSEYFPLLLSIRQSPISAASSPELPSSLNIGMNDAAVKTALAMTNRPQFVLDCYRRSIQDFGIHVLGIDRQRYASVLASHMADEGLAPQSTMSISQLRALVAKYKAFTRIPEDPFTQVSKQEAEE
jgi:hypothetical protein